MRPRTAHIAVWLAIAAVDAALLAAFFRAPIPLSVAAGLLALGALAAWRPGDALLVLAGLGPLAGVIQPLSGTPYHAHLVLEAAVLVVLGGAAVRAALRGSPLVTTSFEWAAVAFAAVALASCLAQLPVMFLRDGASVSAESLADFLLRRYFVERSPAFAPVWQTAVLVEGAALAMLVARAAAGGPGRTTRLAAMAIAGGAGAAALNVHRLLEVSLRNPPFLDGLLRTLHTFRFNTQYPDLNAAGSYFAMIAVLCLGWAGWKTPRAAVCTGALAIIGGALWISGSRVALAATVLCGAAVIVLRGRRFAVSGVPRRAMLAAGLVAAIAFVGLLVLFHTPRHGTFGYSVFTRVELLKTGGRMLAERPLFGVGTSQFYERFPRYASPALKQAFVETLGRPIERENAHNQFLQFLTELGIVGLATFALLLVVAVRFKAGGTAPERGAAIGALAAFLLTCLAGHPLLTPLVATPFWIVLGMAAAAAPPLPPRHFERLRRAVIALGVVLLVSLPLRWRHETRDVDLAGVTVGMSGWQRDESGVRFRWSGKRCAIYVSGDTAMMRVPLRSADGTPQRVEIRLDGRPAAGIVVPAERWIDASVRLPRHADAPVSRRIDLTVASDAGNTSDAGSRLLMVGRPVEIPR